MQQRQRGPRRPTRALVEVPETRAVCGGALTGPTIGRRLTPFKVRPIKGGNGGDRRKQTGGVGWEGRYIGIPQGTREQRVAFALACGIWIRKGKF